MINTTKLDKELKAAGILFSGCNALGVVWGVSGNNEIQTRPDVAAIIAAHDPVDYYAINVDARVVAAKVSVKAIPNWALWTEAQVLDWVQVNIGTPLANGRSTLPATLTLASTRIVFLGILDILDKILVMLISLARLSVALRDKNWPELPEE